MFDFTHIPDYETAARAWLYRVHQDMFQECYSWKRYTDNAKLIDKLVNTLESGEFTNEQHDELYAAIGKHQLASVDVAYFIGLRHGMTMQKLIDGDKVTDYLSSERADP